MPKLFRPGVVFLILTLGLEACLDCRGAPAHFAAAAPPKLEEFLQQGRLQQAQLALREYLQSHPGDDEALFGLGIVETLRAAERFAQSSYQYGSQAGAPLIPFLPVAIQAPNPQPRPVTYEDFRRVIDEMIADFDRAEAALAQVDNVQVKIALDLALIRLDFNGDGRATEGEQLRCAYSAVFEKRPEAEVVFDQADAHWMRVQARLAMAMGEFLLAHDFRRFWDYVAPQVFAKAETREKAFLTRGPHNGEFVDGITAIHLIDWPVQQPQRMKRSLAQAEGAVEQILATLKALELESDDDREWLPNARQTRSLFGVKLNDKAMANWRSLAMELQALLKGDKLLPLIRDWPAWSDRKGKGVNLRRAFSEPRRFDLVLWVQGSAASPYMEEGAVSGRLWQYLLNAILSGDPREFGFFNG